MNVLSSECRVVEVGVVSELLSVFASDCLSMGTSLSNLGFNLSVGSLIESSAYVRNVKLPLSVVRKRQDI